MKSKDHSGMNDNIPLFRGRLRQRLPAPSYLAFGSTWHVTLGTADRQSRPLANPDLAEALLETMSDRIPYYDARLHLCCLMPDHAHLIIQISTKSLIDVVRDLMSVTTRLSWNHGISSSLWQRGFYDHGIRDVPDFNAIVAYILDNPVHAGLADTWENYPYITGEVVAIRE
jgi:REP element-mobilizing transposase RayT